MASRSINQVTLIGRLGRDAETKFTPAGVSVCRFSLATTRRWKDKKDGEWKECTDWHNVVLWRQEKLGQYLTKGKQIYVGGSLQTRSYEKEGRKIYATEVIAEEVILLGGGDDAQIPVAVASNNSAPINDAPIDDDVPF